MGTPERLTAEQQLAAELKSFMAATIAHGIEYVVYDYWPTTVTPLDERLETVFEEACTTINDTLEQLGERRHFITVQLTDEVTGEDGRARLRQCTAFNVQTGTFEFVVDHPRLGQGQSNVGLDDLPNMRLYNTPHGNTVPIRWLPRIGQDDGRDSHL